MCHSFTASERQSSWGPSPACPPAEAGPLTTAHRPCLILPVLSGIQWGGLPYTQSRGVIIEVPKGAGGKGSHLPGVARQGIAEASTRCGRDSDDR